MGESRDWGKYMDTARVLLLHFHGNELKEGEGTLEQLLPTGNKENMAEKGGTRERRSSAAGQDQFPGSMLAAAGKMP